MDLFAEASVLTLSEAEENRRVAAAAGPSKSQVDHAYFAMRKQTAVIDPEFMRRVILAINDELAELGTNQLTYKTLRYRDDSAIACVLQLMDRYRQGGWIVEFAVDYLGHARRGCFTFRRPARSASSRRTARIAA
jgi:hypothetical protein